MQRRRQFVYILASLLLLVCLNANPLQADERKNLEKKLNAHYKGTVLILKIFYKEKKLMFDHEGHPKHKGGTGTWTLYSHIEVDRIKVKKMKYEIYGKRVSIRFLKGNSSYKLIRTNNKIRLELGASPTVSETHFDSLVRHIFFTSYAQLADVLPDYWRPFLPSTNTLEIIGSKKIFGSDTDPPLECLSCPDPVFTDTDPLSGIDGRVIIHAFVNEEGLLEEVRVLGKLHPSIDERILETVKEWILTPFQRSGKGNKKAAYFIFTYSQNEDSASVQHTLVPSDSIEKPRCISCPDPEYNPTARAARVSGTVVLQAIISKDGRAHSIIIEKALGVGLEDDAIRTVKQWKFRPATYQGMPLPALVFIEVEFKIF